MFETLKLEIRGPIGELQLNRPEKLNPLSVGTLEEITASLARKASHPLVSTKRHVNAITDQMLGSARSWADADGMVAAFQDEECKKIRRDYLAARTGASSTQGRTQGKTEESTEASRKDAD